MEECIILSEAMKKFESAKTGGVGAGKRKLPDVNNDFLATDGRRRLNAATVQGKGGYIIRDDVGVILQEVKNKKQG